MNLKPQLVIDKITGKVCMQIRLGAFTATKPLPDEMATWTMKQLQEYFDECVPGMVKHLQEMRLTAAKRLRRDVANGSLAQDDCEDFRQEYPEDAD